MSEWIGPTLATAGVLVVLLVAVTRAGSGSCAQPDAPLDGYPVEFRTCEGDCGLPHQPHEDHGGARFVCHNCGHAPDSE